MQLKLLWLLVLCHWGLPVSAGPGYDIELDRGRKGSYPHSPKFVTSKARVPILNFREFNNECNDGQYYFITPRGWKVSDPGPMILDATGILLWTKHYENKYGGQAYDFKVQTYRGEQYLTFWLGDDTRRGHGFGHYYMLSESYEIVHKIGRSNGSSATLPADLHDFVITDQNTAILTIYTPKEQDVRPFGRKFNDVWNHAIWDCSFQEVDIETGEIIFEWEAREHVNMTSTYSTLASAGDRGTRTDPFDWFHINSVQKDELGNYLVSARNVHAIYYVDGNTKQILWTLGGKQNRFQDLSGGQALNFAWQHDARFVPANAFPESYTPPANSGHQMTRLMSLFDNAAMDWDYTFGTPYSRGLLLEISYPASGTRDKAILPDLGLFRELSSKELSNEKDREKVNAINGTDPAYTVRVFREYINPQHVRSGTQGNAQVIPQPVGKDSHLLVGYGLNAVMTTFSGDGSVLCDAHFGAATSWQTGDVQGYRAFKFPWHGRPAYPPSALLRWGTVYVSWDGATEVRHWVLQASQDGIGNWVEVTKVSKEGFETSLPVDVASPGPQFLRVVALNAKHEPMENGVSDVLRRGYSDTITSIRFEDVRENLWLSIGLLLACCFALLWTFRKVVRRRMRKGRFTTYQGRSPRGRVE